MNRVGAAARKTRADLAADKGFQVDLDRGLRNPRQTEALAKAWASAYERAVARVVKAAAEAEAAIRAASGSPEDLARVRETQTAKVELLQRTADWVGRLARRSGTVWEEVQRVQSRAARDAAKAQEDAARRSTKAWEASQKRLGRIQRALPSLLGTRPGFAKRLSTEGSFRVLGGVAGRIGRTIGAAGSLAGSAVGGVLGVLGNIVGMPYAEGVAYNKGDRVLIHGRAYECLADKVVAFYVAKTTVRNGVPTTVQTTPYWRDLGAGTPMGDPRRASYFDTKRGRGSAEVLLNRCRAAGLNRSRPLRFSKVFPWSVARQVGLRDEVRMVVRDGLTKIPVRGKVEEVHRVIEGGGNGTSGTAWIELTIAPMIGTGRAQNVADITEPYAESGYAAPAYTGSTKPSYVSDSSPGYQIVGTVGDDVEYVLTADTLYQPVNAMQLANPAYAILGSIKISNDADEQLGRAGDIIAAGQSPEYVTQQYPTTLDVPMRPLRTEGNIERQHRMHAQLTVSPRGIDLTTGGEP